MQQHSRRNHRAMTNCLSIIISSRRDLAESERYDDALYGSADNAPGYGAQDSQSHGGYYDDSYAYQDDDGYESQETPEGRVVAD